MRDIIIKTRKEAGISDEALYALFKESYQQWKDKGLETPGLHKLMEKFKDSLRRANVFVAVDAETGELLGMHWFRTNRKHHWVYGYLLAIAPSARREGIASRMLANEEKRIRKAGYYYLKGTTATTAEWSVCWHLKNGYRIIGYYHSPNDNFANYVFRKQLLPISFSSPAAIRFILRHPVYALHSNATFCRLRFFLAYTIISLTKDSNGHDNILGRLGRKVIHKGH